MRRNGLLPLILALIATSGLTTACASRSPLRTPEQWEREVRHLGLDPDVVGNPVAYTPEMRAKALQVAGQGRVPEQLGKLQAHLFDRGEFPFTYDARGTFTAAEAFETRRGNCVSFTNLFIALGRSLGIPVRAALLSFRGDAEREGGLVVVNTHIVAAYVHGGKVTFYDFAQRRDAPPVGLQLIDDLWISAIFLNNRGVEALRAGNAAAAVPYFEAAVKLAPDFQAVYGNLGVARRQAGDPRGALDAYRRVLEITPRDPTVLNNVASLYQSMGQEEEARAALRAAKLSGATPFLLITRGDLELSQGNIKEALKLYRWARRMDPTLAEPLLGMARGYMARGRERAAVRVLREALEIDPDNVVARALLADLKGR